MEVMWRSWALGGFPVLGGACVHCLSAIGVQTSTPSGDLSSCFLAKSGISSSQLAGEPRLGFKS